MTQSALAARSFCRVTCKMRKEGDTCARRPGKAEKGACSRRVGSSAAGRMTIVLLVAAVSSCTGASTFIGGWGPSTPVPSSAAQQAFNRGKLTSAQPGDGLREGIKALTESIKSRFETHRKEAEQRWHVRQAVLGEVTAQNAARALRIGEEFGTRNEAVVDLLEKAQAEKKSNYEGYTVDQLIFMKTHYATLRPSETLLRKQEDERKPLRKLKKILGRGKGQNGEQQQPKFLRSHTDDLSLPVMSPTHEDEVELARRREEFRIRSRQLKHKVLKSHTH